MNIRLLAKEAKCSPATVSRVLNNYPHVKSELRRRVLYAAQKLNYSLTRNSFLIIIPENPDFCGYLGLVLNALQEEAALRDYHLTIMKEKDLSSADGLCCFDGCILRLALSKETCGNLFFCTCSQYKTGTRNPVWCSAALDCCRLF